MKKFICAECGTEFESGSPQARYCTLKCQRTAKTKRRLARDSSMLPDPIVHDDRFFATVSNPTIVILNKYAELLKEELTQGKPIQFFGEVPYWISPNGIVLAEQFGVEPRQWIMQKTELGIMDVLMNKS